MTAAKTTLAEAKMILDRSTETVDAPSSNKHQQWLHDYNVQTSITQATMFIIIFLRGLRIVVTNFLPEYSK